MIEVYYDPESNRWLDRATGIRCDAITLTAFNCWVVDRESGLRLYSIQERYEEHFAAHIGNPVQDCPFCNGLIRLGSQRVRRSGGDGGAPAGDALPGDAPLGRLYGGRA